MILDIPFEIGQMVYIIKEETHFQKEWIPPDYSLGGDADGPFDSGHYETKCTYIPIVKKERFKLGLLDKFKVNEIFEHKEDADWALLLKMREINAK